MHLFAWPDQKTLVTSGDNEVNRRIRIAMSLVRRLPKSNKNMHFAIIVVVVTGSEKSTGFPDWIGLDSGFPGFARFF
jgi:hypothetical protein